MSATPDPVPVARLLAAARALVGTPFLHQGRGANGADCIGFFGVVTQAVGLDLPRLCGFKPIANYDRAANPALLALIEAHATRLAAPVPGAGLLIQFPGAKYPQHTALYTDRGTIIHADARRRRERVVEVGFRGVWPRLLHSAWRIPWIDYDDGVSSNAVS